MKRDILQKEVDQLAIVISPRGEAADHNDLWDSFLVNLHQEPITSVLISSKGYGLINGEKMSTTTLRHFFEEVGPREMIAIEPIQPSLFALTNEYWVSFMHQDYMYDKKFIFAEGTIHESRITAIPFSDRQGIMVR